MTRQTAAISPTRALLAPPPSQVRRSEGEIPIGRTFRPTRRLRRYVASFAAFLLAAGGLLGGSAYCGAGPATADPNAGGTPPPDHPDAFSFTPPAPPAAASDVTPLDPQTDEPNPSLRTAQNPYSAPGGNQRREHGAGPLPELELPGLGELPEPAVSPSPSAETPIVDAPSDSVADDALPPVGADTEAISQIGPPPPPRTQPQRNPEVNASNKIDELRQPAPSSAAAPLGMRSIPSKQDDAADGVGWSKDAIAVARPVANPASAATSARSPSPTTDRSAVRSPAQDLADSGDAADATGRSAALIGGGSDVVARATPVRLPAPAAPAQPHAESPQPPVEPIVAADVEPVARTRVNASTASSALGGPPAAESGYEMVAMHSDGTRYVALGDSRVARGSGGDYAPVSMHDGFVRVVGASGDSSSSLYTTRKADGAAARDARLIEYDVKVYLALEGDTFEQVSRTMFQSPAFADALAKYNRSRLGSSGPIPVGSRVRIPPRWVLEGSEPPAAPQEGFRRVEAPSMAQAVQSSAASAFADTPSVFGLASSSRPAGASADSAFDPAVSTPVPESAIGNVYRASQDETLWSVAAKTLGDGRRWREIQALNGDRLASDVFVPAGVVLRLPDDARPR